MNIELRNVEVFDGMSEETIAFRGDFYVNGELVGEAKNNGRGESNYVYATNTTRPMLRQAESFLKAQPPVEIPEYDLTLPMDVDLWISLQLENYAAH